MAATEPQIDEFDIQVHVVTRSTAPGQVTARAAADMLYDSEHPVYVRRAGVELEITDAQPVS